MSYKIAILEDDTTQIRMLESWLKAEGYVCHACTTGQQMLTLIDNENFDLLLIDWELPDINGTDVMAHIRNNKGSNIPIIFITNRNSEQDIVSALNAGADDYLIKPVRHHEFLARVKATTRRIEKSDADNTSADCQSTVYHPYHFNLKNHVVTHNDAVVELSNKEFDLAYFLFCNEGILLSRKYILSNVWQQEADINTRTVDTHMSVIRKKLALQPKNGWRLKSIYGHGYRLEQVDRQ
ncbi:MAG: response regulator transcription factor [Gammaproteobacteria bacterium]|nr:response regulator transcription factor [Gammaproteobacteria bacterium]